MGIFLREEIQNLSASAAVTFTGVPSHYDWIALTGTLGTTRTFVFDDGSPPGPTPPGTLVSVNISGITDLRFAGRAFTDAVNLFLLPTNITAISAPPPFKGGTPPSYVVTLKQDIVGPDGETQIINQASSVTADERFTSGSSSTRFYSSGIVSLPSRVVLRTRDSATGSYPTISRVGDKDRTGRYNVAYSDTNAVIFDEGTINVGENIQGSSVHQGQLVATPNITADIEAQGTVRPGVGDNNITFTPGEDLSPFEDSRIDIQRTEFYATGTADSVLPGFSSPLWSKTQIKIDITANQEQIVTRNVAARSDAEDPSGEFAGQDFSGFCYFNFDNNVWEQVGLQDPVLGNSTPFDYAIETTVADGLISGTELFPMQFCPPTRVDNTTNDPDTLKRFGIQNIGNPAVTCFAPFATKYHATSSQTHNLQSVDSPFLIEKINVKIPIVARRIFDNSFGLDNITVKPPIDNYVVFLYRQSSTNNINSLQGLSGSQRSLIASASICFYNSSSFRFPSSTDPEEASPFHSPSFNHNWDVDIGAISFGTAVTADFTGTLSLDISPGVGKQGFLGIDNMPGPIPLMSITHYWPGGTTIEPFFTLGSGLTGKDGIPASLGFSPIGSTFAGISSFTTSSLLDVSKSDPRALAGGFSARSRNQLVESSPVDLDAESLESRLSPYLLLPGDRIILGIERSGDGAVSGYGSSITGSYVKILTDPASITLYGSQIRNGIEFHDTLNQPLTSDAIHEDIHSNNPVLDQFDIEDRILFEGSMHAEVNSGSFFDQDAGTTRQVVGSAITGMEESTVSFGLPPEAPGFIRGLQTRDERERLYDSVVPDLGEIWSIDGFQGFDINIIDGTTALLFGQSGTLFYSGSGTAPGGDFTSSFDLSGIVHDFWPSSFPFESRYGSVKRQLRFKPLTIFSSGTQEGNSQITSAGFFIPGDERKAGGGIFTFEIASTGNVGLLTEAQTDFGTPVSPSQTQINKYLFGAGDGISGSVPLLDLRRQGFVIYQDNGNIGPVRGWKYGLAGVDDIRSQAIYRREKYGQFRDLLEQRLDTKFWDVSRSSQGLGRSPVQIRFIPSGSTEATTSGYLTDSQNVSFEATSSLPYFDGQARNR